MTVMSMPVLPDCTVCGGPVVLVVDGTAREVCVRCGNAQRPIPPKLDRLEINSASWVVLACRPHHEYVTSPHGAAREDVIARGWLLEEHQVAGEVPIRLDGGWVLLDDDGNRSEATA